MKSAKTDIPIAKARFTYGLVLMGLGLLQQNLEERRAKKDDDDGEEDGGFTSPTEESTGGRGDTTVTRTATFTVTDPPAQPVVDENIGTYSGTDGTTEAASGEASPADNCVDFVPPAQIPGSDPPAYYSGFCVKWRVCGAERVDDVVSGEVAGKDSTGRFREYLNEMIGYFASDAAPIGAGIESADSVSDFLLTQGLGDPPGSDAIPVFNWCADRDDAGVFDPIDITSVSFGWDLTFEEAWDDYLGTPTVFDLESTIANYGVHEILAVNVFEDTTADEARAILAATD